MTERDDVLLSALEQTIVAMVLIDEQDRVLLFNPAAEKLWGYRREEIVGRNMEPLLPKALRAVHSGYIRHNREGGQPKVVGMSRELQLERKDGSHIWAVFSLSKVDAHGRIYYMAVARDVNEEVTRREQNRLLLLAVNHTDRAVVVLNDKRKIVQVNRAFSELFGYAASEAIGLSPARLLLSPLEQDARARLQQRVWGDTWFQEEVLAQCKDGREVWVRVSASPIFEQQKAEKQKAEKQKAEKQKADDGGQWVRNLVVTFSDVTEERQIRDLERDVLAALTSSLSFEEVGEYLCQRIELIVPEVKVSVCRIEDGLMRPWAAPSFPAAYDLYWEGTAIGEGVASCGTCAARGEPVMVADIATDPLWSSYKDLMLPHGLRACWTYPVKRRDGSVAGTFAFYFPRRNAPDAFLERIADASVHLCALAIDREESRQRIDRLVQLDSLTGLPNRSYLHRYIDKLLALEPEQELAFFSLVIDRFKDINDTLGYAAGDQVLVIMANRLQAVLEPGQFLSRTEGVQFVLVATDCDVGFASALAEQLQQVVGELIEIDGHPFHLSASIGISHYPGGDRETLLANAESAMERTLEAGGNAFQFFSPEMNLVAKDRLLLGAALKRARAEGKLRLEYQPQVSAASGELFGVEALARWTDPTFGEVPPGRFIPLAEATGEIDVISRWALREACRQLAEWRRSGVSVPVVSVNLSPSNFRQRDLPDFVAGVLRESGLPGHSLTIEIIESAMMELTDEMMARVYEIRMIGVGLSVDDFGTGFSSLSNLANLPVTEVKIDKSFIDKSVEVKRFESLVEAVIGIGRSLALTVVAEGVECDAQWRLLRELNCPVLQGYRFAKSLPAPAVPDWITASIPARLEQ